MSLLRPTSAMTMNLFSDRKSMIHSWSWAKWMVNAPALTFRSNSCNINVSLNWITCISAPKAGCSAGMPYRSIRRGFPKLPKGKCNYLVSYILLVILIWCTGMDKFLGSQSNDSPPYQRLFWDWLFLFYCSWNWARRVQPLIGFQGHQRTELGWKWRGYES